MHRGTVHIIGAGLAGLSAAVQLAAQDKRVVIYEAAAQAGGRCRSYHEPTFDAVIDNGNHLLLSGNKSAHSYLKHIGADELFRTTNKPVFHFIDAQTKQRWILQLSKGLIPFWLFDRNRRVPDTTFTDYVAILRLLCTDTKTILGQLLEAKTIVYNRLWHPLFVSALNTHPAQASARLAGAILKGTLLKGGRACIPLMAEGLSATFIDPALRYLSAHNGEVLFNQRVRNIAYKNDRAVLIEFADREPVTLSDRDILICAVPSWNIASLLPDITAPDATRAILNAHFNITPPVDFPPIMGVVGATTEWIFSFKNRISTTVSDADRLMGADREALAQQIWGEVAAITGLPEVLPPWQIVKEKRATFAATPEQDAKRPASSTRWKNVYLAGDWVQTGLPATIEGAIYSGECAAKQVLKTP